MPKDRKAHSARKVSAPVNQELANTLMMVTLASALEKGGMLNPHLAFEDLMTPSETTRIAPVAASAPVAEAAFIPTRIRAPKITYPNLLPGLDLRQFKGTKQSPENDRILQELFSGATPQQLEELKGFRYGGNKSIFVLALEQKKSTPALFLISQTEVDGLSDALLLRLGGYLMTAPEKDIIKDLGNVGAQKLYNLGEDHLKTYILNHLNAATLIGWYRSNIINASDIVIRLDGGAIKTVYLASELAGKKQMLEQLSSQQITALYLDNNNPLAQKELLVQLTPTKLKDLYASVDGDNRKNILTYLNRPQAIALYNICNEEFKKDILRDLDSKINQRGELIQWYMNHPPLQKDIVGHLDKDGTRIIFKAAVTDKTVMLSHMNLPQLKEFYNGSNKDTKETILEYLNLTQLKALYIDASKEGKEDLLKHLAEVINDFSQDPEKQKFTRKEYLMHHGKEILGDRNGEAYYEKKFTKTEDLEIELTKLAKSRMGLNQDLIECFITEIVAKIAEHYDDKSKKHGKSHYSARELQGEKKEQLGTLAESLLEYTAKQDWLDKEVGKSFIYKVLDVLMLRYSSKKREISDAKLDLETKGEELTANIHKAKYIIRKESDPRERGG